MRSACKVLLLLLWRFHTSSRKASVRRLDFGCGGRVGIGPGAKLDFHDWAQVTVAPDQFGITEQQVLAVRVVGVNLDVPCGCLRQRSGDTSSQSGCQRFVDMASTVKAW